MRLLFAWLAGSVVRVSNATLQPGAVWWHARCCVLAHQRRDIVRLDIPVNQRFLRCREHCRRVLRPTFHMPLEIFLSQRGSRTLLTAAVDMPRLSDTSVADQCGRMRVERSASVSRQTLVAMR